MIPQAQTALAAMALVIVGVLTGCLIFHAVPQGNQNLVTFALGALAGALTVGAGSKIADKIGSATNTVQSPPDPPPAK